MHEIYIYIYVYIYIYEPFRRILKNHLKYEVAYLKMVGNNGD